MKQVRLRSLLNSGTPKLGLNVMYSSAGALERIGSDWDWIWIDGQHGEISEDQMRHLVRACDLIERPALVRVSGHDYGTIGKALDVSPAGVIVPGVDTPGQAESIVAAAKFPPLGNRSYGGRRVIDFEGRMYSDTANDEILCVVQIESPLAVANVDQIAAVPGVDVLFLGHDDFLLRKGFSVDYPRNVDSLGDAMEAIASACKAHGKIAMVVGVEPGVIQLATKLGFQLIVAGGDVSFLATGSKKAALAARETVEAAMAETRNGSARQRAANAAIY